MVTITATAEQKIQELMQEEKDTIGLRIYVRAAAATATNTGCRSNQR